MEGEISPIRNAKSPQERRNYLGNLHKDTLVGIGKVGT